MGSPSVIMLGAANTGLTAGMLTDRITGSTINEAKTQNKGKLTIFLLTGWNLLRLTVRVHGRRGGFRQETFCLRNRYSWER